MIWKSALELREITTWEKPIYIKGGARPYFDTTLAVKAGLMFVVDGMQAALQQRRMSLSNMQANQPLLDQARFGCC